jgi:hypothetical protein
MALEGRINFILEDLGPSRTRATANTRYVVTRTVQSRRADGRGATPPHSDTIGFNSGQQAEFPPLGGAQPLACRPTGKLETEVLDLVRRP